jgi:hypothetical protein
MSHSPLVHHKVPHRPGDHLGEVPEGQQNRQQLGSVFVGTNVTCASTTLTQGLAAACCKSHRTHTLQHAAADARRSGFNRLT